MLNITTRNIAIIYDSIIWVEWELMLLNIVIIDIYLNKLNNAEI